MIGARQASVVAVALWVATCRLAAPANAEPNATIDFKLKPGAAGELCRECHKELEATLGKPHLHPLVAKDECTKCHDAHASDHGAILRQSTPALCVSCHEIPAKDAVSVHAPVRKEGCEVCHSSHGSAHAGVLEKEPRALCEGCHEPVAAAARAARFKHEPIEEDGCTKSCHAPHASTQPGALLRRDEQALCLDCHDAKKRAFRTKHGGHDVASAACSGCHDPHGSNRRGMLYDDVHEPVAKGDCKKCHTRPSSDGTFATTKAGVDLCRDCHDEQIDTMYSAAFVHTATRDGDACGSCHAPHASKRKALVLANLDQACATCHADTYARHDRSPTKHEPISKGQCEKCHNPHASNNALALTTEDDIVLCGQCHEWQRHSSHPIGEKYTDTRNPNLTMGCLSCHRAHGTEFKHLMPYPSSKLSCTQCHRQYKD